MSSGRTIRIGRAPDNDIQIPVNVTQVSKHHCVVTNSGGQWVIEDLGSSNHTYVNGVPVRGRATFRLSDSIRFGSFEFDTNQLHGPLGGHQQAAPAPAPARAPAPAWVPPAGGAAPARVVGRPTVFDRAFVAEGGWMPQFLLITGIMMIVLFFMPISVDGAKAVTPFEVLGESGVPGAIKLCLMLLPVTGAVLLILRSMKARRSSVGLAMVLAGAPMLMSVNDAISNLPGPLSGVVSGIGWRMTLGWLAMCGTACALMLFSTRPQEKRVRTLLTAFPLAYIALQLMPIEVMGQSIVPLLAVFEGLDGPQPVVLLVTANLLILVAAASALWFLSPDPTPGSRKEPAQVLAMALALLPGIALFLVIISNNSGGEAFLSAVWMLLFISVYQLLPVLGATLLYIGMEEGR